MISIVLPTYNEGRSIQEVLRRASAALRKAGEDHELIVVDDSSPDRTADLAEALASEIPVRVLRRPGRQGLATAVVDGWTDRAAVHSAAAARTCGGIACSHKPRSRSSASPAGRPADKGRKRLGSSPLCFAPHRNPLLETAPLGYIVDRLTGYISKWLDGPSPVIVSMTRCGISMRHLESGAKLY